MITCYLRYIIDSDKVAEFEEYGRMWIPLVERFGGRHHGYFLPHEGANNVAVALFSFRTLADHDGVASGAEPGESGAPGSLLAGPDHHL